MIKLIFWITPSVGTLQHRAKTTTLYLLGTTHYLLGKGQPPGTTTAKGYYFIFYQQGATVVQCNTVAVHLSSAEKKEIRV